MGFLAVDKPGGITSHDVVARVRRIAGMRKVGHAGTLDPMATGLLVVALGPATRLLRYVQAGTKRYVADVSFGIATDSLDADGVEVSRAPMAFSAEQLEEAVGEFVGDIDQVPPMVSAIKRDGVRLHELARQGVEVEREPRAITIHGIEVLSFEPADYPTARLAVECGAGTYIRVLADDIARSLGGRAHLVGLRRTAIGSIGVASAVSLEHLGEMGVEGALVAPADALGDLPALSVDPAGLRDVSHGRPLDGPTEIAGPIRILDAEGRLVAVYRSDGSRLLPETVLPT